MQKMYIADIIWSHFCGGLTRRFSVNSHDFQGNASTHLKTVLGHSPENWSAQLDFFVVVVVVVLGG